MKVLNCLKIPIKVNLSLLLVLPVVRSAVVEGVVLLLEGGGVGGGVSEAYKTVGRNDNYASFPSPLPALGLFVMHS